VGATKWADIKAAIQAEGGIAHIQMVQLRDAAGWGKLGVNVVVDIANKLRDQGIGTLPAVRQLPLSQYEQVRVHLKNSRVGEVIAAVTKPSISGDKLLRDIGDDDAAEVLDRVREMVCAQR